MTTIRDLWCIVRGHKSRFGPRGPASCEPARARRRAVPDAPQQVAGLDLEAPAMAQPDLALLHTGGEKLLEAARALGRTPALAVMQVDDLPELELVFGRPGVDRVLQAIQSGLTRVAAGQGLVVRTAADTFALLTAGGGAGAAIAALQARFGKPCTIELGFGRDEILVVPDVMVHPVGPQDSVAQVYADLCRYVAKARKHRQAVLGCVPQQVACDSAASASPIHLATCAGAPRYIPPLPATIPVPLALH